MKRIEFKPIRTAFIFSFHNIFWVIFSIILGLGINILKIMESSLLINKSQILLFSIIYFLFSIYLSSGIYAFLWEKIKGNKKIKSYWQLSNENFLKLLFVSIMLMFLSFAFTIPTMIYSFLHKSIPRTELLKSFEANIIKTISFLIMSFITVYVLPSIFVKDLIKKKGLSFPIKFCFDNLRKTIFLFLIIIIIHCFHFLITMLKSGQNILIIQSIISNYLYLIVFLGGSQILNKHTADN